MLLSDVGTNFIHHEPGEKSPRSLSPCCVCRPAWPFESASALHGCRLRVAVLISIMHVGGDGVFCCPPCRRGGGCVSASQEPGLGFRRSCFSSPGCRAAPLRQYKHLGIHAPSRSGELVLLENSLHDGVGFLFSFFFSF